MVFDFTPIWVDGQPGNVYFWIPYILHDLNLDTPKTPGSASVVFSENQSKSEILQQIKALYEHFSSLMKML